MCFCLQEWPNNYRFMHLNQRKNKGFTLIEMMVAVSIFVIVAFIVTTTLLTMSSAYKKAQKMRVLMDNLSFSIQDMSLAFREGKNYSCLGGGAPFAFCALLSAVSGGTERICFRTFNRAVGGS